MGKRKKHGLRLLLAGIITAAYSALLTTGCAAEQENGTEQYRVTAILPAKNNGIYWKEVLDGIEEASVDEQVDLGIIYTESYNNYPAIDLNSALEMTIFYQADAVIVSYSGEADERTDELLREAREKGIKIVMIDNDVPEDLRDACVEIDNVDAGRELAQLALDNTEENGTALLIYSEKNIKMKNMALRREGIEQVLREQGTKKLVLLSMEDESEVHRSEMLREVLEQKPKTDVIFTLTEGNTKMAVQSISQYGLSDQVQVYGFDYTDETADLMEKGKICVLIGQNQKQMGYESVKTAVKLLRGETCDQVFIAYQIYSDRIKENETQ